MTVQPKHLIREIRWMHRIRMSKASAVVCVWALTACGGIATARPQLPA